MPRKSRNRRRRRRSRRRRTRRMIGGELPNPLGGQAEKVNIINAINNIIKYLKRPLPQWPETMKCPRCSEMVKPVAGAKVFKCACGHNIEWKDYQGPHAFN